MKKNEDYRLYNITELLPKHLQTKRSVLAVGIDCCVLVNTCVRGVAFTSAST